MLLAVGSGDPLLAVGRSGLGTGIEESRIGRYRVRVAPGLTLRLHDPERGKVKTRRWEKGTLPDA